MRAWEEASWAAGATSQGVIERVGQALARRLCVAAATHETILVLAGKGNNGADARAALPHLGMRPVELLEITDPVRGLEALNIHLAKSRPDWIVDGLFGIGLSRPLDDAWRKVIAAINASGATVVAVDIPSGLDCDLGTPAGEAIRAALTLTIGAPKIGMIREAAAEYVGRVEVLDDVGLTTPPTPASECYWGLARDFSNFPPRRAFQSHKGTYGHLTILAGNSGYHGAAALASRSALRARPGLVSLVTLPSVFIQLGSQLAAVMVHRWKAKQPLPDKSTAVLAGPGLSGANIPAEYRDWIQRLWRESFDAVIADAGTLDWLPRRAVGSNPARVITPHPGEAARMLRLTTTEIQADRVRALRELSKLYGESWVVLKGNQTLIGRSQGPIYVNGTGNPGLAQGGTGDVLAGFIAGHLAQPAMIKDPLLAIRYAVWEHGAAADRLEAERTNWSSEELLEKLGDDPDRRNRGAIWRTPRSESHE